MLSQQIGKRYNKNFGTSVIYSPFSFLSEHDRPCLKDNFSRHQNVGSRFNILREMNLIKNV